MAVILPLKRFDLYLVKVSPLVKMYIPEEHVEQSLKRHQSGDYGIQAVNAWERNDRVIRYRDLDFNFVTSCYDFVPPVGDVYRYTICTDFDCKETEIKMYEEW